MPHLSEQHAYRFIDSHCHLDAQEYGLAEDQDLIRERARKSGVDLCLIPAVERNNFLSVRDLAHRFNDLYALGIHPLYTTNAKTDDLLYLRAQLTLAKGGSEMELTENLLKEFPKDPNNLVDQHLVAVGEIGLDGFVKTLDWERQVYFFEEQLKVAAEFDLPVVLHVRQAVDFVLKGLRKIKVRGGIAHAFNGSAQQAQQFIDLGFKLGMGGALTYPRALHLRRLVQTLPAESIVLETDSPDIVPAWRYVNAQQRFEGQAQARNEPSELPSIAQEIANIRGEALESLMVQSTQNFLQLFNLNLPKLNLIH